LAVVIFLGLMVGLVLIFVGLADVGLAIDIFFGDTHVGKPVVTKLVVGKEDAVKVIVDGFEEAGLDVTGLTLFCFFGRKDLFFFLG